MTNKELFDMLTIASKRVETIKLGDKDAVFILGNFEKYGPVGSGNGSFARLIVLLLDGLQTVFENEKDENVREEIKKNHHRFHQATVKDGDIYGVRIRQTNSRRRVDALRKIRTHQSRGCSIG